MRHPLTVLLAATAVLLTACGSAAEADPCAAIADEGVAIAQVLIDEAGELSLEELAADPQAFDELGGEELDARAQALEERQAESGCTEDELAALLRERADDLEGEGLVADLIRQSFRDGDPRTTIE
jgi:predicted outer membrane protein